jgi:signal peptidase I
MRGAALGLAIFFLMKFVAQPVRIHGSSMEPTYHNGSFHAVNLLAYRKRPPRRGDIVAVRMVGSRTYYLKRVLGVPGDTIAFTNGQLLVNGAPAPEPYLREAYDWSMRPVQLAPDEYFVAGDNRAGPMETHVAGVVRQERIAGSLWF